MAVYHSSQWPELECSRAHLEETESSPGYVAKIFIFANEHTVDRRLHRSLIVGAWGDGSAARASAGTRNPGRSAASSIRWMSCGTHRVALIEPQLVEPLPEPIGLEMAGLHARARFFQGSIQFISLTLGCASVLRL
jgi:hypothetical protein